MSEMLARFRDTLPRADTLAGGSRSGDALVRRFLGALSRSQADSFRVMLIGRGEFAWLFFPHSRIARPPYELDPEIAWMRKMHESRKGIARAYDRLAGHDLRYVSHRCAEPPERDGPAQVWRGCTVTFTDDGRRATARLFFSIIELDGRFKFFSYANDF